MFEMRMLIESVRMTDIAGHIWRILHYLLVELPFALLRLIVVMIGFILDLIDIGDGFVLLQQQFFDHSRRIFANFMGGSAGNVSNNSLGFIFISVSVVYLAYQYFFGEGNWGKKVLHVLAILIFSFAWFGTVSGTGMSGGIFLIQTVDEMAAEIGNGIIDLNISGGLNDGNFARFYEEYIIVTTFNFINSGTVDGCYGVDSCLDMELLIPASGLSPSEMNRFEDARQDYVDNLADDNPFVRANGSNLILRLVAVILGYANGIILAIPIVFTRLTIVAFRLLSGFLILFVPFAMIASFIPMLSNALFKMIKTLLGISFIPVVLGFLLSIFFYINQMIDVLIFDGMTSLMQNASFVPVLGFIAGGVATLVATATGLLIKIFILRMAWRSKGALLGLVTGGMVSDNVIDIPTAYVKEYAGDMKDKVVGVGEIAVGAYTGNVDLVHDGVDHLQSDDEKNYLVGRMIDSGTHGLVDRLMGHGEVLTNGLNDDVIDVETDAGESRWQKEVFNKRIEGEIVEAEIDEENIFVGKDNKEVDEIDHEEDRDGNFAVAEIIQERDELEMSNLSEIEPIYEFNPFEEMEDVLNEFNMDREKLIENEVQMLSEMSFDGEEFNLETTLNSVHLHHLKNQQEIQLNDDGIHNKTLEIFKTSTAANSLSSDDLNTISVDYFSDISDKGEVGLFDYLQTGDAFEDVSINKANELNNFSSYLENMRSE